MYLHDLPLGAVIQFGRRPHLYDSAVTNNLVWRKVSYDQEFICISEITEMMFDEAEPIASSREHRSGGNNFYSVSNVDQWLNATEVDWFTQRHDADMRPHSVSGFLHTFTSDEIDMLVPRTINVKVPPGSIRKYGKVSTITRLVSLPSVREIIGDTIYHDDKGIEGDQFTWFAEARHNLVTLTRSATGQGSVFMVYSGSRTVQTRMPCRVSITKPVIKLKNSELEQIPSIAYDSLWSVVPHNPFESENETEFLSLLTAH